MAIEAVDFRFHRDRDGERLGLEVRVRPGDSLPGTAVSPVLVFAGKGPGSGPALALLDPGSGRILYRSPPLPGEVFRWLREILARRGLEGLGAREVSSHRCGPGRDLELVSPGLDCEGHYARAVAALEAGDREAARRAFQASDCEAARAALARLGMPGADAEAAPAPSELDPEELARSVMRAVAADGRIDEAERRVLRLLAQAFPVGRDRLAELWREVSGEPRPSQAGPLDPEAVLREAVAGARRTGRVGPSSRQLVARLAQVLGVARERVAEVVRSS